MKTCPCLINGELREFEASESLPVFNPSTGEQIAAVPAVGADAVDAAVRAAVEALPDWSAAPPGERAAVLFRFRAMLEDRFEELARGICLEHGKTFTEARGEMRRAVEAVEFACGIPSLLMGESLENIARGIDCVLYRQPVGVCAGITPFNFPAMVPLWMYPLALACGNTFILKPSEKVPLSALRMAELLHEAGLPPGVLNVVNGGRESVDALLTHPDVRAVSFVGSSPVARHIQETGIAHGKRVQAAGGAKNFVVILPDADVDRCAQGVTEAAFGCAGERCMAGSMAVAVGAAGEKILPVIAEKAAALTVGRTDIEEQPAMGPVITAPHRDRVSRLVGMAADEGAAVLTDGREPSAAKGSDGFFLGATVMDHAELSPTLLSEELFGPVLSVCRAKTLDEAIALANKSAFGNGAAVFTSSGRAAREFRHRVKAGMVGINIGVPAPMAFFPFTGWDESFFGDLHLQGREAVAFYTRSKVVTERWFTHDHSDVWQK